MDYSTFDLKKIGSFIKANRAKTGMTQSELAQKSGISRSTINALENNKAKEIGVTRIHSILEAQRHAADTLNVNSANVTETSSRKHSLATRIGLSFPYDWSNSKMPEDLLIMKVIERGALEDVVRTCVHFGLDKVEVIHEQAMRDGVELPDRLPRMLGNIKRGLQP